MNNNRGKVKLEIKVKIENKMKIKAKIKVNQSRTWILKRETSSLRPWARSSPAVELRCQKFSAPGQNEKINERSRLHVAEVICSDKQVMKRFIIEFREHEATCSGVP